jgi:hypothetical protein
VLKTANICSWLKQGFSCEQQEVFNSKEIVMNRCFAVTDCDGKKYFKNLC